ncbi:MAG: hypothetical protein QGI32_20455 [Candidatus Latescibacteria bacterium]|nr:hypothetical protein [Candidatus Latescibacterota bacterium]
MRESVAMEAQMRLTTRSVPVPDRRKFIKSGAVALVSAILPVWGCDSHQVQVKGAPTAPGIDLPQQKQLA